MAAVLKKRALAEYSQTIQETPSAIPTKKLRLVKKPISTTGKNFVTLVNLLEECKTSNEALNLLLQISDTDLEATDIAEVVKKLGDHFKNEKESSVRVKILSLLYDIGFENNSEIVTIIDETISLIKNDSSHKVIAQGMNTILKLGGLVTDAAITFHNKLVEVAKVYLKDTSHIVKSKCLEILGVHFPLSTNENTDKLIHLVRSYFNHDDARVRCQAFSTMLTLHERNFKINPNIYVDVSEALKDDYEIVRFVVLKLIWLLGNTYPENEILVPGSEHEIRLIDDAFGKICNGVTDLSMNVRMLAAKLLGTMKLVSPKFLCQTLDKKLMSNMRRKRTAHELAWENVTSGEWASGKKWADDAPKELIDADSISLMSSGACGAFVHGLEDEYLEVRSAAVESLCQLSITNPNFANMALDFLVDMFNDEIEDVRLKAIDSLRLISEHIILRDDQLETILGALEDFSQEVREGLHGMLASCRMSTSAGLKMCAEKLLDNLKRYPQDKRSTYRCLQMIGVKHPELVLPLVPQFLNIHPFFDTAEPDVENPQYICLLILILNAAKRSRTIVQLLEPHTLKHYLYLRDTMTQYVPVLNPPDSNFDNVVGPDPTVPESLNFLNNVINNLDISDKVHGSLLQTAKDHLNRLSEMDGGVAGAAQFTSLYISAQLEIHKILEKGFWANPSTLATQQSHNLRTGIENLLQLCLKLQFFFVGLTAVEQCSVKQVRLRALALNLVYVVKGSNASALAPCHHFLTIVEDMQKDLAASGLRPDHFTGLVLTELAQLEEPKPGAVARILIPILTEAKMEKIPTPNIDIKMSSAVILEPSNRSDTSLKFTAGLIMSVPFEAELVNLIDPGRVRLKIKYPDQRTQIVLPRPAHMKPLSCDKSGNGDGDGVGCNVRLLTSVLISHQVWSEACDVEINVALAIPEADIGKKKNMAEVSPTLLDLCRPIKVGVAPKPIKKTL